MATRTRVSLLLSLPSAGLPLLLAIFCGCISGSPVQAMTAVPFGEVVATSSGKCLQVQGASTTAGAAIVQSECVSSSSELWELEPAPTVGYYQLSAGVSGECLAVSHSGAAALVQEPCAVDPYQEWQVTPQAGGGYTLTSEETLDCVGVQGAGQADGTALVHGPCSGASSQLLQFEQPAFVAQAPVNILSQSNGQCVGVTGGSSSNYTYAVTYMCGAVANSTWKFVPISAGVVEVVNSGNGLCLGVYGQSTSAGGKIDEYTCVSHTNQYWALVASGNFWQLVAQNSGQCLTLSTGSPAALVQEPCTAATVTQQWSFHTPTLPASWTAPVAEKSVAVAAANLPNGKILTWASDSQTAFAFTEQTYTELLDPVAGTDSEALVTNTSYNMFCPGIANLPDGTILVNGGDTNDDTAIYNYVTNAWTSAAHMNVGRAYEGTVLNYDNTVFTLGGSWSTKTQGNTPGELWNSSTNTWTLLSDMPSNSAWTADSEGAYRADNHMWLHVLSGGRLLQAGPSATMHWINVYANNGLGSIVSAGARGTDGDSMNGNASAFTIDKLLKVGGAPNYDESASKTTAALIDASGSGNPVVTMLAPMNYARGFGNSVVLPNGQVVVVGGQTYDEPFTDTDAVLVPELWDPITQVFQTMAPMATPRTYHGTALLLPDGRVWVSGGGLCGTSCGSVGANHLTYEILTPPYLLTASGAAVTRPVISAVSASTLALGATFTIQTQAPVKSFALMRLSSVTHTVNNDQRRIPLVATTPDGVNYTTTLSSDSGVLIAGYYMLFAIGPTGVPSMAYTLLIT